MYNKGSKERVSSFIIMLILGSLFTLGAGAQGKLPGGAQMVNLWAGYLEGSYYGVARSGSSFFVTTDKGVWGPYGLVSPLQPGRDVRATSFIAKDKDSWFLIGPAGEKFGPYRSLESKRLKEDESESRGKAYRAVRADKKFELLFDDGRSATSLGIADEVFIASASVSADGMHCAVPAKQGAIRGILWDGVFLGMPLLGECLGIAFGGDLLFVTESAGENRYLVAIARGAGVDAMNRGYKTPLFHDVSKSIAAAAFPMPEGYGKFIYGFPYAAKAFGEDVVKILIEQLDETVPLRFLPGPQGFALQYKSNRAIHLLTATGRFGPFGGALAPKAEYAVPSSGEAPGFTTGAIDKGGMSAHKGDETLGSCMAATDLRFREGDPGLYWVAGLLAGDRVCRDGKALTEVGSTARLVRVARMDSLPGGNTRVYEAFDGLYSITLDEKSYLYRIKDPEAEHELVAGPFNGEGSFSVLQAGERRRIIFDPSGLVPPTIEGANTSSYSWVTGFALSSDGGSIAFSAEEGKGKAIKEFICLNDRRFGPFASTGYPAFLPATSTIVFSCSDKKGLRLAWSDGSSVPLKGTMIDPLALGYVRVSDDGKVVEVTGYGRAPGAAKEAESISFTYVLVEGKIYSGSYDPVSGATVYWDAKAKSARRLAHR